MSDNDELRMEITNNNLPLLENLDAQLRNALHLTMKRIAVAVQDRAVGHIQNQDLNWTPLSPGWARYKEKHGYSDQIYIMTSSYMQNITWQYVEATFTAEIGVMRSALHFDPQTGRAVPMWRIAEALEYGYDPKNVPARPLWRPVHEESLRSSQTRIGLTIKSVFDKIAAQAQAAGGPKP